MLPSHGTQYLDNDDDVDDIHDDEEEAAAYFFIRCNAQSHKQ